ncbi:QueT transporter family protein, partial [Neisseria sp. P0013.S004]
MKKQTVRDLTHIAIVAALYVVLTVVPPFNLISYGPYQFRIAEMFNLLGFYNRKYIIAVTLGCVIANFFSFNMIDVVVGSLSTLVFVGSGVYFFDRFKNQDILGGLFDQAHVFFAFYFSFFMVTIAAELTLV